MALSTINGKAPQTFFDFQSAPDTWFTLIIWAAFVEACRMLLTRMQMFQYRRLFQDVNSITTQLRTNASEVKAQFEIMLPQIKRRGYAQAAAVTTLNAGTGYQVDNVNFTQFTILA